MNPLRTALIAMALAGPAAASNPTALTTNVTTFGPGAEPVLTLSGRAGDVAIFLTSPTLGPTPYPKIGSIDIGPPSFVEVVAIPSGGFFLCPIPIPCLAIGTQALTGHFQIFTVDPNGPNQPVTGKSQVVSLTYDPALLVDCNSNLVADSCDIDMGTSQDVNTNGIPDECEIDCDQDGIPDGLFPVGGCVWHDLNGDGVQGPTDLGVRDVLVTLYDATDNVVAGTTTDANGKWKIADVADPNGLRVEFTDVPDHLAPAASGNGTGTPAQYVFGTDCAVDLALVEPAELCVDQANAWLATPCYISGDPLGGGTAAGLDVLVRFPYAASGSTVSSNVYLAQNQHLGSTWGLAYSRSTDTLFAASFLKRHSGFGPGGIDAIYAVADARTGASSASNVSVWLNVNTLPGQNVGTVTRNLPANFDVASYDPDAYANVGKVGLGGLDLSGDEKTLYVVNLNSREVLAIDVATRSLVATHDAVAGLVPTNGEARPFAVEEHRGELYVGVVATGEGPGGTQVDLTMHVRRLVNGTFQDCLTAPLNFPKGVANVGCPTFKNWFPWVPFFPPACSVAGPVGLPITFPEPILADLEFAPDGTIALGFIDRMSHLTGAGNLGLTGTNLHEGFSGGDLLKAYVDPTGACFLEQNGSLNGVTTAGAGNNEGPGGGEFYFDDRFGTQVPVSYAHLETALGGVARLAGTNETTSTVYDPAMPQFASDAANEVRSGGVRRFDDTTGATNDFYRVYSLASPGAFGKAAGLGDVTVLCAPAAIEVGNALFVDANGNGVRDPGEAPLAGVTIDLFENGASVATTVSAADGSYGFSGLAPCTDYELRIALNQSALAGFVPATPNAGSSDLADSDGVPTLLSGFSIAPFTTGVAGENDFTVDFGFANG